jgi:hypothetical protein
MLPNRSLFFLPLRNSLCFMLGTLSMVSLQVIAAEEREAIVKPSVEPFGKPRSFDKRIADRLGVSNVAYLLAVDVNGNVVPFIPDDPKASFRVIDPLRDKLTLDLHEIASFTIIAGKRNPFCVIFVGGGARKLWMESCP